MAIPEAEIRDESWRERRNRGYFQLNRTLGLTAPDGSWVAFAANAAQATIRGLGTRFVCILAVRRHDAPEHTLMDDRTHRGAWEADIAMRGGVTGGLRAVTSLTSTPDGSMLVAGCADGRIRRWRISDLQPLEEIEASRAMITAVVSMSPTRFVIGTVDGRLGVVGESRGNAPRRPHTDDAPYDLALTPDGHHALCIGRSGSLSYWDARNGQQCWGLAKEDLAADAGLWQVRFTSLAFSADGSFAALYFVDDDMYGGLGIVALQLLTGKPVVLFDPDGGTKQTIADSIGVGLRGFFTRPNGNLVVVTANGTEFEPTEGPTRSSAPSKIAGGPPAQDIGAYPGPPLDPSLRLSANDPLLLQLVDAADSVRAQFSLDEPVAAARVSADGHVVVASAYGHLTFLRMID